MFYLFILLFSLSAGAAQPFRFPLSRLTLSERQVTELEATAKSIQSRDKYEKVEDLVHAYFHAAELAAGINRDQINKLYENARLRVSDIINNPKAPDEAGVRMLVDFLAWYLQDVQWSYEVTAIEVFRFMGIKQNELGLSSAQLRKGVSGLRKDYTWAQKQVFVLNENNKNFLSASSFQSDRRIPGLRTFISMFSKDFQNVKVELNTILARLKEKPLP